MAFGALTTTASCRTSPTPRRNRQHVLISPPLSHGTVTSSARRNCFARLYSRVGYCLRANGQPRSGSATRLSRPLLLGQAPNKLRRWSSGRCLCTGSTSSRRGPGASTRCASSCRELYTSALPTADLLPVTPRSRSSMASRLRSPKAGPRFTTACARCTRPRCSASLSSSEACVSAASSPGTESTLGARRRVRPRPLPGFAQPTAARWPEQFSVRRSIVETRLTSSACAHLNNRPGGEGARSAGRARFSFRRPA